MSTYVRPTAHRAARDRTRSADQAPTRPRRRTTPCHRTSRTPTVPT